MNWKLILLSTVSVLCLAGFITSTVFILFPKATPMVDNVPTEIQTAFQQWQMKYNKNYMSSEEATYRLTVFQQNYERIQATNSNPSRTYKAGLNQFSDMTQSEFKAKILMNLPGQPSNPASTFVASGPVASSVDWRTKDGVVTPVKDQGQCGSCWSFSTTGVLEGTNKLQVGTSRSFAEQQLVDCCGADGFQCQGCSGAWPYWALDYVKAKKLTDESKYPYTAMDGQCKESSVNPDFTVSSYTMLPAGDESALVNAVNKQPVSICVDASTWFDYSSGVFDGCNASPGLDHAVLLVGYTDTYYIVKNSWNTSWGEEGYIRLPRGSNACGLTNSALIATK